MFSKMYTGIVEDRNDPLKIGRCRVRIVGLHSADKTILPTEQLPWSTPILPVTSAGVSGIGHAPVGPVPGSLIGIVFADEDQQQPLMVGAIPKIPQSQTSSIANNALSGISIKAKALSGGIESALGDVSNAINTVTDTVSGVVNTVNNTIDAVTDTVSGVVNTVNNTIDGVTGIVNNTIDDVVSSPLGAVVIDGLNLLNTDLEAPIPPGYGSNTNFGIANAGGGGESGSNGAYPQFVYGSFVIIPEEWDPRWTEQNGMEYTLDNGNTWNASEPFLDRGIWGPTLKKSSPSIVHAASGIAGPNYYVFASSPSIALRFQKPNTFNKTIRASKDTVGVTISEEEIETYGQYGFSVSVDGGANFQTTDPILTTREFLQKIKVNNQNLYSTKLPNSSSYLIGGTGSVKSIVIKFGQNKEFGRSATTSYSQNIIGNPLTNESSNLTANTQGTSGSSSGGDSGDPSITGLIGTIQSSIDTGLAIASALEEFGSVAQSVASFSIQGIVDKALSLVIGTVRDAVNVGFGAVQSLFGFMDPSGKYPLGFLQDEQDTNRLARGNTEGTIIDLMHRNRTTGIFSPDGQDPWQQPQIDFRGEYPYTQVHESESGHVQLINDTPGKEATCEYHRSGTFTYNDQYGRRITKIVTDNYTIVDRDGNISIKGNARVAVNGNINIVINGDANVQFNKNVKALVKGKIDATIKQTAKLTIEGNAELISKQDLKMTVGKNFDLTVGETFNLKASKVKLSSAGDINTKASGTTLVESGSLIRLKAPSVKLS